MVLWPRSRRSRAALLRPHRHGDAAAARPVDRGTPPAPIEKAFELSKTPAVAVVINSPGGSPVQSSLIFKPHPPAGRGEEENASTCSARTSRHRAATTSRSPAMRSTPTLLDHRLHRRHLRRASASTRRSSKLGIERRVYTAGEQQGRARSVPPGEARGHRAPQERAARRARRVHRHRQGAPRRSPQGPGRRTVLRRLLVGPKALELGLIDGISDVRSKMRELYGDKVRLKVVPLEKGGLLGRLRRSASAGYEELRPGRLAFGEDLISAVEARALWSRFGL